jgi:N-glycosidase YbiA
MSKMVRFCIVEEPFGKFSNQSPHSVFLDRNHPTVDDYVQAQRNLDREGNKEWYRTYMPEATVPEMHRRRKWLFCADWDEVKDEVMRIGVGAKIQQHYAVRDLLLSTGNATIVYHDPTDDYWADGGDGSGQNMLGQIYMEFRAALTKDGTFDELANPMVPPWERHPEIPAGSIGWRMGYGEDYMSDWHKWFRGVSPMGRRRYAQSLNVPEAWENWAKHRFKDNVL